MDTVTRMLGDTGPEPFTVCGDGALTQQLAWALHSHSPWDKGPAWQREVGAKAGDWGTQSISAWPQGKTEPGKGGREAERSWTADPTERQLRNMVAFSLSAVRTENSFLSKKLHLSKCR